MNYINLEKRVKLKNKLSNMPILRTVVNINGLMSKVRSLPEDQLFQSTLFYFIFEKREGLSIFLLLHNK